MQAARHGVDEAGLAAGGALWRFSANLGFLWRELPLPERIRRAAQCGFDALEFHDDVQTADGAVIADALAEAGLPVVAINVHMGETAGSAAFPERADDARRDIDVAVAMAVRIGARAVHVLSGMNRGEAARSAYIAALRHALGASDLEILVEPLSPGAMPGYLVADLAFATAILEEIGHPRLRLLFDCFHIAAVHGDVAALFRDVSAHVGHVQIASWPDRAEPGTLPDYAALMPAMRDAGYRGAFGCEYRPATTVEAGLGWRDALLRRLPA
jgi:hydroxypyruvate isomerase